MQFIERQEASITVVSIEGEIDLETSPKLRMLLRAKAKDQAGRLLLDFTAVTYIDSSGLATLIEHFQATRGSGGSLALAGLTKRVNNAFEIVRLHEILAIYPDVPTALTALG